MSNELDTIKQELAKEKQLSNFYHHLYEREHAKNEELHAALIDLRKKCEKWYNSTEMEEEMLVNKLISQIDEMKNLRDPTTRSKSASFDSFDHDSIGGVYQRKLMNMQHEMAQKEKNIESLQQQLKNYHKLNGKEFHLDLGTIEE